MWDVTRALEPWDQPHEVELAEEAMVVPPTPVPYPHGKPGAWVLHLPLISSLELMVHNDLSKYQWCRIFGWFTILFTIFRLSETLNLWAKPHQTKDILGTCYVCCTAERFVVYMTSKSCNRSISVLSFSAIDHPTIIAFSFAIKRWLIHKHFGSRVAKAK